MKKIGMLIGLGILVTMLSSPVYPLSYQIDFNGEGGYDTSWDMSVGDRIRVAIWLDDYTCLPDDKLLGVQLYVQFDSNKLQTVEAFPNDVMHGGPFDRSLSGFLERKPGIYNLTASHFDYVRVSRDRILIGTIMLEAMSSGNTTIKAANKLGMDDFNDGFVADCSADNLGNPSPQSLYPDDAVAVISISNCVVESIYGEHSKVAETLRHYRDNVLNKTPEGRELIKLYYLWSPVIVKAVEQDEEFKKEVKQMIKGVLPMIEREME